MHTKDLQQLAIKMLHDDSFSIEYIMFVTGYSKAELASILYNLVEEKPKHLPTVRCRLPKRFFIFVLNSNQKVPAGKVLR